MFYMLLNKASEIKRRLTVLSEGQQTKHPQTLDHGDLEKEKR